MVILVIKEPPFKDLTWGYHKANPRDHDKYQTWEVVADNVLKINPFHLHFESDNFPSFVTPLQVSNILAKGFNCVGVLKVCLSALRGQIDYFQEIQMHHV